jgi:superfamily II DNA or RNA helicase
VRIHLDDRTAEDYRLFLAIKQLPSYRLRGNIADIPDEYAARLGLAPPTLCDASKDYEPSEFLFDYQRDISRLAIRRRKFAIFADPGLGKTLMMLEYIRHTKRYLPSHKNILIVCPLMVVEQTLSECERFYGSSIPIQHVRAKELKAWLANAAGRVGITNYEAIREDLEPGRLGCLCIDESSSLKSHYGKWGTKLIELGKGLEWKLALTGTPAPNDRIEYANHAVLLDAFPTVNSFLATYFVNRGETSERWELKPHALGSFYRALSHWCIFLSDPSVYGWRDNVGTIPPIEITIHDVPMGEALSARAREYTGKLFVDGAGGIVSRGKLARMAREDGSPKPEFIRQLVESWTPEESTLIWCRFNDEQAKLERLFPEAASIDGQTPEAERSRLIRAFQTGETKVMLTKGKILGFGLNLQVATRQVFSGIDDSYESMYQAVKRSNRVGSTRPLNVHFPVTELERPMLENVLRKARMIERDTREQEVIFRDAGYAYLFGE